MLDVSTVVIQTLQEKLRSVLGSHRRLWVGYSGGVDSHVLLHALCQLRDVLDPVSIGAIHIHHGLNPEADAWAIHCQHVCVNLQIPCIVQRIDVTALLGEHSLEEAARLCRYRAFAEQMDQNSLLLLAHTENDQAETVLLQLLRGGGVDGLAAMPLCKKLGEGMLMRPFLSLTRANMEAYAQQNSVIWIEDSSNYETRHDRNYLRLSVLPTLARRWSAIGATLARTAAHFSETRQLLAILAQQDWVCVQGSNQTLSITQLLALEPCRQKNVIRYWLRQLEFPIPSSAHLQQILQTVLTAAPDAQPMVCWTGVEIRRFRDKLYAMMPLLPHDPLRIIVWEVQKPLCLPELNLNLSQELLRAEGVDLSSQSWVTVRFRVGGERYKPLGRQQTHCLKKLFQAWGVLPWLRDRVPLVYVGDCLVWVGYKTFCDK